MTAFRKRDLALIAAVLVAVVAGLAGLAAQRTVPPNIVIILADDLGYGDLGVVRQPEHQDAASRRDGRRGPEVDQLLRPAGLLAEPCRAADRTACRSAAACTVRPRGAAPKVFRDNAAQGLPLEEITIAELLKPRGYATGIDRQVAPRPPAAVSADAHRDSTPGSGCRSRTTCSMTVPRDNGYTTDAYYDPKPEYWDVPLMRNGDVIERPVDHRTLTRRYTEEAVRFIDAQQGRGRSSSTSRIRCRTFRSPGRPSYVGHSAAGIYGDVVEEIDGSTGRILDALRAAGIDRQTLVVFTSDNGPWLPFETPRRIGRSAPRRQRHDVGRRRADAGDLLVAGHGRGRRR